MDKGEWRRRIRAQRAEGTEAGSEVTFDPRGHVQGLASFLDDRVPGGSWIVVYDAMADEVALDELVRSHPQPDRRFAITRTPEQGHRLTVHPVHGPTERHRYGYRQPRADGPTVADTAIGAVLVPGLAFDRRGVRLGRGGGYYDRFLARLDRSVLRIGVSRSTVLERLPAEDHDVAMTHLATAEGVVAVPLGPLAP